MSRQFTLYLLLGLCMVVCGSKIKKKHFRQQLSLNRCDIDVILKYPDVHVRNISCDQEGRSVVNGTTCIVSIDLHSNYTRVETVRCEYGHWKNTVTSEEHHRQKRNLAAGILAGGIGLAAVYCLLFCEGEDSTITKVEVREPPKFLTCFPADLKQELIVPAGQTSRKVTWTLPTATDPDSESVPVVEQTFGNASGSVFQGSTTGKAHVITYKAKDGDGLTDTCFFTFTVLILSCPPLPYPSHGNRYCPDDNILGASCTYICDEGYELSEEKGITCQNETNPSWTDAPMCNPITCGEPLADLENGHVSCQDESFEYGSICSLHCNPGYELIGEILIVCQADKTWTQHSSSCKDATTPQLSCVTPQIFYADRGTTSTAVAWEIPIATDDVDAVQDIAIRKRNGPEYGAFISGTSYVGYEAIDSAGNISPACTIELRVQRIECVHPRDIIDDQYIKFQCDDQTYVYGTQCNVSCLLNLPLNGTNLFTCEKQTTSSGRPEGYWSWGTDHEPFCELINCPDLSPPVNGALVQNFVLLRPIYTMFCNENYTVASVIKENGAIIKFNGQLTCTDSGDWIPIDYAPGCTRARTPGSTGLLADVLYYSGECGTEAGQEDIRNRFAHILANVTEFYQTLCPSRESCSAENTTIVCGEVSERRKRDDDEQESLDKAYRGRTSSDSRFEKGDSVHNLTKRQATQTHYIQITFYISIAWNPPSSMSIDDAFDHYDAIYADLTTATKNKVSAGWFQIDDGPFQMTLDENSFHAEEWSKFRCDDGEMLENIYCVPCPVGHYLNNDACSRCPIGTYSDSEGALTCTSCQPGYSTRDIGSNVTSQCIPLCSPGTYSPDGLETCSLCPVGKYQSGQGQFTCLQCPSATTTIATGSTTLDQCVEFDAFIGSSQALIPLYKSEAALSSFSVDFWIKPVTAQPIVQLHLFSIVSLTIADIITVDISGRTTTLPQIISSTVWTHVAVISDLANNTLGVYVNGDEVFRQENLLTDDTKNTLSGQSGTVTLSNTGSAAVYISGFHIAPFPLTVDQIQARATSCHVTSGSDVVDMDVFKTQSVPGITVSTPSACDAINECLTNPCRNHTCINEAGGYTCVCSRGTTGTNCEIPPDFCAGNKCENGATCMAGNGDYNCKCRDGFSGNLCEIEPRAGQWSSWSPWGECSHTCGGGTSTRQRSCDSPPPEDFGEDCVGDKTEGISCNMNPCRSCPTLRREDGTLEQCTTDTTTGNRQCTLHCSDWERYPPGYNGSQEVYTCGQETGYEWEPKETTLACSILIPPQEYTIKGNVTYTSTIDELDEKELGYALQNNTASAPCFNVAACNLSITVTGSHLSSGSPGTKITLAFTIPITETGDMNLAAYIQNQTVSPSLQEVIDAINSLEATATYIEDNFDNIFNVSLSGVEYSADADSLQVQADVGCASGQAAADGLCSDCPVGTYLSNNYCHLCEKGSYQDASRQLTCIECPSGYTTVSIGSTAMSQCLEITASPETNETTPDPGTTSSTQITTIPETTSLTTPDPGTSSSGKTTTFTKPETTSQSTPDPGTSSSDKTTTAYETTSQTNPDTGTTSRNNNPIYIVVGFSVGALLIAVLITAIVIRIYTRNQSAGRNANEKDIGGKNDSPVSIVRFDNPITPDIDRDIERGSDSYS